MADMLGLLGLTDARAPLTGPPLTRIRLGPHCRTRRTLKSSVATCDNHQGGWASNGITS